MVGVLIMNDIEVTPVDKARQIGGELGCQNRAISTPWYCEAGWVMFRSEQCVLVCGVEPRCLQVGFGDKWRRSIASRRNAKLGQPPTWCQSGANISAILMLFRASTCSQRKTTEKPAERLSMRLTE